MEPKESNSAPQHRDHNSQTDFVVQTFSINIFDQRGNHISEVDKDEPKPKLRSIDRSGHKSMQVAFCDKENECGKVKPNVRQLEPIAKRVSIKIQTPRSDGSQLLTPTSSDRGVNRATQTQGDNAFSTKTLLADEYDEQDLNEHLKDAQVFLLQGDFDRMVEFLYSFRNRYRQTNERLEYRWNVLMAVCKLQKRQYSDVAKFIQECRRLYDTYDLKTSEREHMRLLNMLGVVYTQINLYRSALMALQAALVMAREHHDYELYNEALNNLGVVYLKAGMVEEALEVFKGCYQKKLQLLGADSPNTISTIFNVVECYTRLERFEAAMTLLTDLKKFLTEKNMVDELCELHIRMVAVEHMRGKPAEAKTYIELAKQYVTDKPDIRYGHLQHHIGLLEMTQNDHNRARKCLEEACKIYVGFTNKDNDLVRKGECNLEMLTRINSQGKVLR